MGEESLCDGMTTSDRLNKTDAQIVPLRISRERRQRPDGRSKGTLHSQWRTKRG